MDRQIVYTGAIPQTSDVLGTNKSGMVGQAFLNQAILGSNTVVAGLACAPTVPASLQVTVGTGSIYQLDPTDATAYGDLGTDNTVIVKQGILRAAINLTITPPGTGGFSQVYLVEAILNDLDAGSTVLSYYNSANPLQPYAGPANSGISQFTTRTCPCVIALKAGVPATTGTQVAPSVDAGYVPLFTITVANGAVTITSGNIAQVPLAPFFPTLPSVPGNVLNGSWVYAGQDTGTANNYVITFLAGQPIPTSYVAGMGVKFKALNANSGASVINVNGLGNVTIRRASGAGVATGDIISGQVVELTYDGTFFQMQNYMGVGAGTNTNTQVGIPYIADSGTLNALIGTYSPVITSGQQVAGLTLAIKLANTITGACTINVNGLGVKSVTLGDATNPPYNIFTAGEILILEYDGTRYQIANTSAGMFYKQPTANYTIFVNTGTGSDTLYDGTASTVGSGTSGPLKTIGKAVLVAFSYAPSQFTITIQVAAGTYAENIGTPAYAGPNLVIDGGSASTTFVNGGNGHAIVVNGPNTLLSKNIQVSTSNTNLWGGFVAIGAAATHNTLNTISGSIGGAVYYAQNGGTVTPGGTHTFNGSSAFLWWASPGYITLNGGVTFTFAGAISVSVASAGVTGPGQIAASAVSPPTFVNPAFVSGVKFQVTYNGVIQTSSLGLSFFPGTVAGTYPPTTGGQVAF